MDESTASRLYEGVRKAYSAAAEKPLDRHPFPIGRQFAESIGYPKELLDTLPEAAMEAFAGVSNVAVFADIPDNSVVLDVGCGSGLDSLIAARRTGPGGKVIGVDFSEAMLGRARAAAETTGLANVEFIQAAADKVPLPDGSVDIALVNGIFNLNPKREELFRELARVVRRGGTVFAAELVLTGPVVPVAQPTEASWFA